MDLAISRQEMKDLRLCEKIVKTLGGDGPQRVVLIGKSGIGKTRLARKISEHATNEGLCYLTILLHLNQQFEDELSLYENIAFQIEVYNRDEKDEKKPEDLLKALKEKISTELSRKKRSAEEKMKMLADGEDKHTSAAVMVPYLLLILDDEGNKTSEDKVMKFLGLDSFVNRQNLDLKLLITKREDENTTEYDDEIESNNTDEPQDIESDEEIDYDDTDETQGTKNEEEIEHDMDEPQYRRSDEKIESHEPQDTRSKEESEAQTTYETHADIKCYGEVEFHTTDESQILLDTLTENNLQDLFDSLIEDEARDLLDSLQKTWKIDDALISRVARKSISLPAAIVVLAKSLNCITQQNKSLSPKQEKVLKEALSSCESAYSDCGYNPLLHLAYKLLETDDTLKSAIVDCFWHSLDFFKHCGCVYYSELITMWILEGYFDPVRSVKMAYKDGHDILVELINRGILKIQEDDMIVPEMAMSYLIDLRHHGLLGRSQLRFSRVHGGDKNKGLGKITQIDDMIKTVQPKKGEKIRTILVSGNRLRRERPEPFFKHVRDLEVVGFFNTSNYLPWYTQLYLQNLRVLVIRDCDLLSDIKMFKALKKLNVLEVSGASSMKCISDWWFVNEAPKLQSLNLSGLGIISSPTSISKLKNLCSLILRDCSVLEDLPDIQELMKLEVVDVRGARKLKSCFGKGSNNRNFRHLRQLRLLDFSETKIKRLPIFHDAAVATKLHSLTQLSLHNCRNLIRLPNLKPLSGLQILDLSGTTSLLEITEVCFEQKEKLKILNLSGTKFSKLPSTISNLSNLSQLLLRDSSNLEALPNIKRLTSLEVFDVSGCTKLQKIEGSFKDMSYLREVNLSSTRIETLPELPEKSSICCSKLIVLADSRSLIHDTWGELKEAITNGMTESVSSSDAVERIQEISRKKSGSVDQLWAFDSPEKKGRHMVFFYQGHIYRDVYMNTIPFVDTKICQEVLEIQGSYGIDQDKETLAKAEFVAFVDNSAASLSSIFNDLKAVKGCWLEMCLDINILFSGVDEECLRNLETLSITNLPLLDNICSRSFKNLKKLSLDCCPSIKTLFLASEPPTSLEILKIKFCDKLEKVFSEEVELPNMHTLSLFELPVLSAIGATLPNLVTYKADKCPKLKNPKETLNSN